MKTQSRLPFSPSTTVLIFSSEHFNEKQSVALENDNFPCMLWTYTVFSSINLLAEWDLFCPQVWYRYDNTSIQFDIQISF